ncbi:hypothetical protein LMTR13_24510 [Bradyrhizobium icense]|uniref:Uncharacterized protein n=1 Tax=Bradyrhizobium icense TaxID=1274631 RepID=A0A1B1UJA9_9BRAD|nr:hypothetical protein LMTR13_24510 [Bradyrhizobium icense]
MAFHHREPLAAALLAALPRSAVSLGVSLKTDLMQRIGRIEKHFNYISLGLDGRATPAATLENLQFAYDHNSALRKKSGENIWIPWDAPFMQGHKTRLMETWKQRYPDGRSKSPGCGHLKLPHLIPPGWAADRPPSA